jgi:hypothetical protein
MPSGDPDAARTTDGATSVPDAAAPGVDAGACATLVNDPAWLEGYLTEVVEKLSGAQSLGGGVTLTDRASVQARDLTRAYIQAELTASGLSPELHTYGNGANVLAVLPATRPATGRTVVLGAHFDGIPNCPAAADDGTGVAIVLALARQVAAHECRERDVIFVLFDQEEIGLVGSEAFAAKLASEGGTQAYEVHSFDMISFDGDGDRAIELWSPSPGMADAYVAAGEPAGVPIRVMPFEYSDHWSFLQAGFTATGVSEEFASGDYNEHYHTPQDTAANVDFAYLAASTRVILAAIGSRL